MKTLKFAILSAPAICGILEGTLYLKTVNAQLIPDTTFSTLVTGTTTQTVNGGVRSGNNLFHSFSQFSIPTNGKVLFNNDNTVQTIFSRVTGSTPSLINGSITTRGTANLFLLNPNGILFGPKASLSLGGSFVGTTAERVLFDRGGSFGIGTVKPDALLTLNVPIGLQFGSRPGPIEINQTTLRVPSNQSLLLAGNNLNITGKLYAEGGRMDLASINGAGVIELFKDDRNALGLRVPESINRGNLTIGADLSTDLVTRLYTEAPQGGSLTVTAQNADLLGDTAIYGGVKGTTNRLAGDLNFDIRDRLFLDYAAITNRVNTGSKGHAGNINIRAGSLHMIGGSFLSATTRGIGNAGSVQVAVRNGIWLDGQDTTGAPTGIFSSVRSTAIGNGGNVSLNANNIRFTNGAIIELITQGKGNAGRVSLQASDRILFAGAVKKPDSSGIWYSSSILNDVGKTGIGNGGDIDLVAPTIEFTNGADLLVNSRGQGNAGNILVQASKSLTLDGKSDRGIATAFQSDVEKTGVGNGGNITIQTPLFQASRGAFISVDSAGKGGAGNLEIKADRITLFDNANLQANANDGNQGNITLQSKSLSLRDQSHITAIATGKASGGNISINSDLIIGLGDSDIVANAIEGQGGNIKITTQGMFGFQYRDRLTSDNDITASSEFGINGNVQVNTIGINPANALNELPSEVSDSSRQIADRCGASKTSSFIATGRGGMPQSPMKKQGSDRLWNDVRPLTTTHRSAPIALTMPKPPIVEATAFSRDETGAIALIAPSPIAPHSSATCALPTMP